MTQARNNSLPGGLSGKPLQHGRELVASYDLRAPAEARHGIEAPRYQGADVELFRDLVFRRPAQAFAETVDVSIEECLLVANQENTCRNM